MYSLTTLDDAGDIRAFEVGPADVGYLPATGRVLAEMGSNGVLIAFEMDRAEAVGLATALMRAARGPGVGGVRRPGPLAHRVAELTAASVRELPPVGCT